MPKSPQRREWKNFKVSLTHLPSDVGLIELEGDFDQQAFSGICDFTDESLMGSETAIIIDMSKLDFMDSSGVKFINRLVRRFGYGNVAVYKINEDVNRIFSILALDNKLIHLNNPEELHSWRGETRKAA